MPIHKKVLSAIVIFVLTICPAHATETGWYIGLSGGESDIVNPEELDEFCNRAGIVCGQEETDTTYSIFGGYQFSNFVAVEGGYFNLGEPSLSTEAPIIATATAKMSGGSFAVLPQIPISSIGALFGKIGLAIGNIEISAEAPALARRESASATGGTLIVGAGGAINLGPNVSIRVEWTRYAFDQTLNLANVDIDTPDINTYVGSIIIRFPRP